MALLNRFLQLLEFLEWVVAAVDVWIDALAMSGVLALLTCLFSYEALVMVNCDRPSAAILSSTLALTLHCSFNRPNL
ncbi:MAG: hypothetical protein AAF289_15760 [Cyanobacteria bacterium P01_A01_bin.135]